MQNLGIPEELATKKIMICGNHFVPGDVIKTPFRTNLRRGAMPIKMQKTPLPEVPSTSSDSSTQDQTTVSQSKRSLACAMTDAVEYYHDKCKKIATEKNRVIKNLRMNISRRNKKITSLSDMVKQLKSENILNENTAYALEELAEDVPALLFERYARNKHLDVVSKSDYPPPLRKFAMTLYFYSPKAYLYVREKFQFGLPHPSTISKW